MSILAIRGNNSDYFINKFDEEFKNAHKAKISAQKAFEAVSFPLARVEVELLRMEEHMGLRTREYYVIPKGLDNRFENLSQKIKKVIEYSNQRFQRFNARVKELSQKIQELKEKAPGLEETFKERESKFKIFEDLIKKASYKSVSEETQKVIFDAAFNEVPGIVGPFEKKFDSLTLKIKKLEFVNAPQDIIDGLVEEQKALEKKLAYDVAKSEFEKIAIRNHEVVSMGENLQPKILAEFHEEKHKITEQVKAKLQTELDRKLDEEVSKAMEELEKMKAKPKDIDSFFKKVRLIVETEIENKIKKEVARRLCEWIEPRFKEAEENYKLQYEREVKLCEKMFEMKDSADFDPKDERYLEIESEISNFRKNTMKPFTDVFVTAKTLKRLANYEKTMIDFELSKYNISKKLTGISGQLINFLMRIVEVIRGLFN